MQLRIDRLRRQLGSGFRVEGRVETVEMHEEKEARAEISMPADLWPRLGAKLGLALGSRGMDEQWLRSDWAKWLRACLRGERAEAPDSRVALRPLPDGLLPGDPLELLVDPPNHVVFFAGDDPTALMFHLFGVWRYVVPLGPGDLRDRPAWTFDPREGTATEVPFISLVVASSNRAVVTD